MFKDRKDAGRRLAAEVRRFTDEHPVVLAIPRGGVPVAYEVAVALKAPLDVILVRKLGAPGQPELAVGAVVDGDHPDRVLNEDVMALLHVSEEYLRREVALELEEIRRRQERYRSGRPATDIAGRLVIVVDDGLATGASMRAALRGLRSRGAKRIIMAVPVAPPDTLDFLRSQADEVVCLSTPVFFQAVGQFYADFTQTSDEEVIRLLDAAQRHSTGADTATASD